MPITRRTTPKFRLVQSTQVEIIRKTKGAYDSDGVWQEGVPTTVTVEANVQPMKYTDLMLLPESDRTKEWITLYSVDEIRTAYESDDGWDADEVLWEGKTFKVMKCHRYQMGVLDHYAAHAAREPVSARGV